MAAYRRIDTAEDAAALAERLNGNDRSRPLVVVTIPAGQAQPWIDLAVVAEKVGDLAEYYLMPTGPHSWVFSHNLPPMTQVYGGAGRVYPVGHEWASEPRTSPLRFAYDANEGRRAADLLADDALRMAVAAGLLDHAPTGQRVRRTGTVRKIVAERAWVALDRDVGLVPDFLAFAGVPLERTVVEGMELTGLYDPHSHWFDVRESRLDPADAMRDYAAGDLVLGQVEQVEPASATIFLHPLVAVTVTREQVTSNPLDDLRSLMSPGEVLTAHVLHPGPDWQLSLLDVDDDEVPVAAVSLFMGGPPWLEPPPDPRELYDEPVALSPPAIVEPPHMVPAPEPTSDASAEPVDSDPTSPPKPSPFLLDPGRRRERPYTSPPKPAETQAPSATVQQMSLRIDALRADVVRLESERDQALARAATQELDLRLTQADLRDAEARRERLDRELTAARSRLRLARNRTNAEPARPRFADRERGFRFLVEAAWATRIPPSEQPDCPLPDYDLGPAFLDSVDALDGMPVEKVADVVMEVLTGKAQRSPGRDLHRLRESATGGSPYVVRQDGALAWRVNLQTNTASARRLHYWELPGGRIELAKVGLHDDFSM
jgi:hypothetical protein